MHTQRSLQILIGLATLATLTACATYGHHASNEPDPGYSSSVVAVQWDSGPLDQDYQHQRADMEARHAHETDSPRDGESADQRNQRQTSERRDLEDRYAQGKASHANRVPSSDQRHDDKSHQ